MSDKPWCIVWSHARNALTVEPLEDALSAGRIAYGKNEAPDGVPIMSGGYLEMVQAAEACRGTLFGRVPPEKRHG
jgi:hypothetical protein